MLAPRLAWIATLAAAAAWLGSQALPPVPAAAMINPGKPGSCQQKEIWDFYTGKCMAVEEFTVTGSAPYVPSPRPLGERPSQDVGSDGPGGGGGRGGGGQGINAAAAPNALSPGEKRKRDHEIASCRKHGEVMDVYRRELAARQAGKRGLLESWLESGSAQADAYKHARKAWTRDNCKGLLKSRDI